MQSQHQIAKLRAVAESSNVNLFFANRACEKGVSLESAGFPLQEGPHLLWMDEILHHFETMVETWVSW